MTQCVWNEVVTIVGLASARLRDHERFQSKSQPFATCRAASVGDFVCWRQVSGAPRSRRVASPRLSRTADYIGRRWPLAVSYICSRRSALVLRDVWRVPGVVSCSMRSTRHWAVQQQPQQPQQQQQQGQFSQPRCRRCLTFSGIAVATRLMGPKPFMTPRLLRLGNGTAAAVRL